MLLPNIDTVSITRASFSREAILLRYSHIFYFADLFDDATSRRRDWRSPPPVGTMFRNFFYGAHDAWVVA